MNFELDEAIALSDKLPLAEQEHGNIIGHAVGAAVFAA
ncbi:hypothetical protein PALA111701_24930 [Paenibacillus lactis]